MNIFCAIPIVVALAIGYYVLYKLRRVAGNIEHKIEFPEYKPEYHEPTPDELQAWE